MPISNTGTTSIESNMENINHSATRNIKFKSKCTQWQLNSEKHCSNAQERCSKLYRREHQALVSEMEKHDK